MIAVNLDTFNQLIFFDLIEYFFDLIEDYEYSYLIMKIDVFLIYLVYLD